MLRLRQRDDTGASSARPSCCGVWSGFKARSLDDYQDTFCGLLRSQRLPLANAPFAPHAGRSQELRSGASPKCSTSLKTRCPVMMGEAVLEISLDILFAICLVLATFGLVQEAQAGPDTSENATSVDQWSGQSHAAILPKSRRASRWG